ncbi:CLUMA_CG008133, isoform A [Clunio marinus]|uniref:CLUMA_CG008133, isoform A n=1 Tax=Clunio marinus TaxID=568069 RepID=A0A1J1I894_9DIPT|nr:CLUMA_CG008133, isoform A [Clunio marinus]
MFRTFSTTLLKRLEGKICVVTASSDGIGFAIAKRLGVEGAKIVVSSREQANVDEAVNLLKKQGISDVLGVTCHVAKENDRTKLFDETIKKFGGIDVLVSNAAVNPAVCSVLQSSEEAWDKIFDVNVKASYLLAKEVKPYIIERGGGSIVFISSIGGYQPFDLLGAYSVSKTALFGLTKAASLECVRDNIRVNCVAPGVIETKFSSALYTTEAAKEETLNTIPMRRLGKPDEIGSVVAFLVSDDASFITGECIVAAGGAASRL